MRDFDHISELTVRFASAVVKVGKNLSEKRRKTLMAGGPSPPAPAGMERFRGSDPILA
jgi:hypothetical protein